VCTIRRRLRENNFYYGSATPKPHLTEEEMEKRLEWARANKNRNWTRVMFSDEVTFRLFYYTHMRLWKKKGIAYYRHTKKHGPKANLWGCCSSGGFGRLHSIDGNLNKEKMVQIYKKSLKPSADKLFGRNKRNWELLEDGDPKHTANICKDWKTDNGVKVMNWPAKSPDLNPIENVWAILKKKVSRWKITTASQLKGAVTREWNLLSDDYARELAESCPTRVQCVIDNNGGPTKY
jgi:hypothetical protein